RRCGQCIARADDHRRGGQPGHRDLLEAVRLDVLLGPLHLVVLGHGSSVARVAYRTACRPPIFPRWGTKVHVPAPTLLGMAASEASAAAARDRRSAAAGRTSPL